MPAKKLTSLDDLYLEMIRDLYNAEQQLTKALPKMAKAATDERLSEAFTNHLSQTETHVERLEKVFKSLGVAARGKKCAAMEGLIEEGKEALEEEMEPQVLDAALIAAAQKVEHYEIASYGTVCVWAEMLGYDDQVELLTETLNEEKETDELLTEIAESSVNAAAE